MGISEGEQNLSGWLQQYLCAFNGYFETFLMGRF